MAFKKGNWVALPSNCSNDYTLTFTRCAEYGELAFLNCVSWVSNVTTQCIQWAMQVTQQCAQWASQTSNQCTSWAQQTSQQCCNWWPCSWLCSAVMTIISWVCVAFSVIVTWVCLVFTLVVSIVCLAFALIVSVVCAVFALVEIVFCLIWSVISIVFCLSNMDGGTAFLLTDGTIMMQESQAFLSQAFNELSWGTRRWWKLTPDQSGTYTGGTWSRLADSNIGRTYYASAVLADGRVLICGGEWSDSSGFVQQDETNSCEIYDPVKNTWTVLPPPTSGSPATPWPTIGDAAASLLPDGTFLISSNDSPHVAKLDATMMTWTAMGDRPTSSSTEEAWVLMPKGTIAAPSCAQSPSTWDYQIAGDTWVAGANLASSVVNAQFEIGPGLLLYNGTGFFLGATNQTAVFSPTANPTWSNGPVMPAQSGKSIGVVDGPAALLTSGSVLFSAGFTDAAGDFASPCMFFEFDGTTFNRTNDPSNNGCPTNKSRLLLLPNGEVLFAREDDSNFFVYQPASHEIEKSLRPVIKTCPTHLVAGSVIKISGTQFNGLSQAVAYGDDCQNATNYPLVRIVAKATSQVTFCRTFNHTTVDSGGNTVPSMGVATGTAVITTNVSIPGNIPVGHASLFVIANGIPSEPFAVTIAEG